MSRYSRGVKYFAYGYISVLFIRIHPFRVCERLLPTVSFLFYFIVSPLPANVIDYYIFCFDFLWCGEFGHLSAFCLESSYSSKTNPCRA